MFMSLCRPPGRNADPQSPADPTAVLALASRFQRVSWKYSGMAYATQLKNAGAIYMAFYLAATAMGLSPCGLGLGSIDVFARLTGCRMEAEGSVGEFALSGPPA